MKKALALVLSVLLAVTAFTALPITAGAITRYTYGDWEYEIWSFYDSKTYESHDEICITNYTGSSKSVSIPNTIDGKPVTYMYNNYIFGNVDTGDYSQRHFANHETMTKLSIPENMRYIAGFMLMDCTALEDITISSANKYFEYKSGILYMKEGGKSWGDHVSYHASDEIADEYGVVFAKFSKLTAELPTKVTTIHSYAFYNHEKLTNCAMPSGKLKKIEDYAFYNSGIVGTTLNNGSGQTGLDLPYGLKSIGYSAFMYCKMLHAVSFPSTIKKIGSQAFLETNIHNYYLPSTIEEIGYQAFGYSGSSDKIYVDSDGNSEVVSDYNKNTGSKSSKSSGGGLPFNPDVGHDPDKWYDHVYLLSTSIPPTCTAPGLTIYGCYCGKIFFSEDTIIPATGHDWKTKRVYPTCTEQGYTLTYCANCGESSKSDFRNAYGHWKVNDAAVEPTATTAGKTAGVHCGDCGLIIEQQKLIPPTGYTEKENKGVKVTAESAAAPTVTEITDEAVVSEIKAADNQQTQKVYDIKLEKDGETVQPEGDVIVKIPCDSEAEKVYRAEEDGTYTDMKAYYDEGELVFATDHFSTYVVTEKIPEAYDLWVNNEQFTEDHLTVECGEGTATFDPKENILTLDNAQITKGAEKDWLYTGILDFLDDKLTIVINGDCTITETGGDGIGSYEFDDDYNMIPHDITLTGDGSLTITESTPVYGYGFYCTGKLTLDGVAVNIQSAATGIWSKELSIKNNSLILSQCSSRYSGIVVNNGGFTVEDSAVSAESVEGAGLLLGNDKDSSSLMVSSGSLTLKGVVGVGSDTDYSRIAVTGGTLEIEGQKAAVSEKISSNPNNLTLGEGVEIVSGAIDSTEVIIKAPEEAEVLIGDVNGDGEITVSDATDIQKYLVNLITFDDAQIAAADADGDGNITVNDATQIQKLIANMVDHLGA